MTAFLIGVPLLALAFGASWWLLRHPDWFDSARAAERRYEKRRWRARSGYRGWL